MAKIGSGDFLSRWSRRKRGEQPDERQPEAPKPEIATTAVDVPETEDHGDPEAMANLPDIDSMDDTSDFKVFLQAGVPEALRRRALRKLWRVNPVLANLDGLNDYDEDYTQLHTWGRGMKTLYQVGKGFVTGDSEGPVADAPPKSPLPLPEPPVASALETPEPAVAESAAARTEAPAESTAERRDTARRRRWGAPESQS